MHHRLTFTETIKDNKIHIEVVVKGYIEERFTIQELPDLSERFTIKKGNEPANDNVKYLDIESAIKAIKSYSKRNY